MMKISAAQIAGASLAILLAVPMLAAQAGEQAGTSPSISASPTISASPAVSKVRMVRLSEVKGQAQMDCGAGSGFESVMANMPVVENCRLQTGEGVAEVEFEDNSSLRLTPNSEVEFPTLERLASGATVSSVRVVKGMAYVSLMKGGDNEFNLLFGQRSLELPPASHVRLQMEGNEAQLAVLDGAVQINDAKGTEFVSHKRTITYAMAGAAEPTVAGHVAANPFDAWDHQSAEYLARVPKASAFSGTPYTYGMNDMMYYGDFADMGGCGMMWRPYFASAAWDPYSNGAWAWYGGGMGYSWVSPYPWGWIPYHYGSWSFCPGAGWGWMPGGAWMGVNNTAGLTGLRGPIMVPKVPIRTPRTGGPGLLLVNQKPLIRSQVGSPKSFVFRRDSAGLGVPRDQLGKLKGFSRRADAKGTASTPAYMQVPVAYQGGRATLAGVPTMRRGFAPPPEMPRAGMGDAGRMGPGQMGPGRMGGPQGSMGAGGGMGGGMGAGGRMSGPSMGGARGGGPASAPAGHGR